MGATPGGDQWATHGTHGSPMGLPFGDIADSWISLQCWPMGRPWFSPMGLPWFSVLAHGSPMGRPWVSHGFPVLADLSPVDLPLV